MDEVLLFDAIKTNDFDMANFLLVKYIYGEQSLVEAINTIFFRGRHIDLAKKLWKFLDTNVDLEAVDQEGITLLSRAIQNSSPITKLLLSISNLDVTRADQSWNGFFPFWYAAKEKNKPLMRNLLSLRADVNRETKSGHTAFALAFSEQHDNSQKRFINFFLDIPGIDVNKFSYKQTPLMCAVRCEDKNLVRRLLNVPTIDLNLKDAWGENVLDLALSLHGEWHEITQMIQRASEENIN